jgi:hypothetical protein
LLEYVFLETMTVMMVRRDAGRTLLAVTKLDFIPCSEHLASTFDTFPAQTGTRLSFTDAAVAVFAFRQTKWCSV